MTRRFILTPVAPTTERVDASGVVSGANGGVRGETGGRTSPVYILVCVYMYNISIYS